MVCSFEPIDENILRLDGSQFALKVNYGIDTGTFMEMFRNLVDKHSFRMRKAKFEVEIPYENGTKKPAFYPADRDYINFVIYSNLLEQKGICIDNLVRQILPCKDYLMVRHACSLAILAYIYSKHGYSIEFLPRNGCDFAINDIRSDLKVQIPLVLKDRRKKKHTKSEEWWRQAIMLDLSQRLSSRLVEGIQQADLVYFDCSEPLWGLVFLSDKLNRLIEPRKERVVFYDTHFFRHDKEVFWHSRGMSKSMGRPVYPDLYAFSGCYIDFDPYLWRRFHD